MNQQRDLRFGRGIRGPKMMVMVKYYPILHKFIFKNHHRKIQKLQVCEQNRFICFNKILTGHVPLEVNNVQQISPLSGIDWVCFICNTDLAEPGPKRGADRENWQ